MSFNHEQLLTQIIREQLLEQRDAVNLELWRGTKGDRLLQTMRSEISPQTKLPIILGFTITSSTPLSEEEIVKTIQTSPDIPKQYIETSSNPEMWKYTILISEITQKNKKWICTGVVLKGILELIKYEQSIGDLKNSLGTEFNLSGWEFRGYIRRNVIFPHTINTIITGIKDTEQQLNNIRTQLPVNNKQRQEINQVIQSHTTTAPEVPVLTTTEPIDIGIVITPQSDTELIRELQRDIIAMFNRHPEIAQSAPPATQKILDDFLNRYKDDGKWGANMSEVIKIINAANNQPVTGNRISTSTIQAIKNF
jgi:hypothetical protein